MFRSILVPVDGSQFSEHALPPALGIRAKTDAALHVVLVHLPLSARELDAHPAEVAEDHDVREAERVYLDELRQRLGDFGARVQFHHTEGLVAEALEQEVALRNIDLVVMSTHGRGYLSRAILGSVTARLLRHLTVPLLLVHPPDAPPRLEPTTFRHALVALDGSALAEGILGPVRDVLGPGLAEMDLLRVVVPPHHYLGPFTRKTEEKDRQALGRAWDEAEAYLAQLAGGLRGPELAVRTHVVAHAQPAAAILGGAAVPGCDLVALATHGRGPLPRMILGSVTDKVVRSTSLPVLVWRGPR